MQINVILVDPLDAVKVKTVPADIQSKLQTLFDEVARVANAATPRPNPPHSVKVAWSATKPSPADTDILIYFLTTEVSVVGVFAGKPFDPLAHSHWGYTNFNTKEPIAASEVYAKNLNGCDLAALAFHEAMHHKLLRGNELHNGNGLAAATVECSTPLTDQNKQEMARVLTRKIKQWTDGYDKLVVAKKLRDQGDPMWYLAVR